MLQSGDILVDPYLGFPNMNVLFDQRGETFEGSKHNRAFGPSGIRSELMLSDKVGIGLDFIYTSSKKFKVKQVYDDDLNKFFLYEVIEKRKKIRLQLRMNYHFYNEDGLDCYVGIGAGNNWKRYQVISDVPRELSAQVEDPDFFYFPMSMRLCGGTRYFIQEDLAIQCEVGLGGPLISLGLCFRL